MQFQVVSEILLYQQNNWVISQDASPGSKHIISHYQHKYMVGDEFFQSVIYLFTSSHRSAYQCGEDGLALIQHLGNT